MTPLEAFGVLCLLVVIYALGNTALAPMRRQLVAPVFEEPRCHGCGGYLDGDPAARHCDRCRLP